MANHDGSNWGVSSPACIKLPWAWLMGVGASIRQVFMLTSHSTVKGFRDELGEYAGLLPNQSISPLVTIIAASWPKVRPQIGP
jgi:hypothetical protein